MNKLGVRLTGQPMTAEQIRTKREWAVAQRLKSSAQTQADVDEVLALAREDTRKASDRFRELAEARGWPLWVQSALADVVRGLMLPEVAP